MPPTKLGKSTPEDAVALSQRPDEMRAYLEWVAVPPEERDPPGMNALAKKLGVDEATVYRWQRDPRLQRDHQGAVATMAQRYMPRIVSRLAELALEGPNSQVVPAANMIFKIIADDRADQDAVAAAAGVVTEAKHLTSEQLRDLSDALASVADEVDGRPVVV